MPLSPRQPGTGSASTEPSSRNAPDGGPAPAAPDRRAVRAGRERTRTRVAFNSLLAGVVVLILLLVFILENTQRVKISYFGATGHISLGVALLVAAVGGALLVGLAGAARVLQLRQRLKRTRD